MRTNQIYHDLGIKSLAELWEEIEELGKHSPIICNGLMFKHISEEPISNEYVLAAIVLVLAGALDNTQKQLISYFKRRE